MSHHEGTPSQPPSIPSSDGGQRFANLIQQLHAIVWEAHPETLQATLVSDYAEQILGYPTEQWLTESDFWLSHIHPEDRKQTITTLRSAIRERRNCNLEYRMLAADGHAIWFRDLVQIESSEQGRPQRLIGVMIDIGRRKSIEEALHESEEQFLALLHHEREAWGAAERRATEELALRQAIEAISIHFTVESVIQQIAASGISATNADGAFVEKVDSHLRTAEVVAAAGELSPALGEQVSYTGSYVEAVLGTGEPILLERVADANRPFYSSIIEHCPDCAALIIPLIDAGEAVGALTLLRRRERWGFRPDEIARARVFSNLAALAFGKAHLLRDAQNKRTELERVIESRDRLMRGFTHDVKNPLGAADGYLQMLEMELQGTLGEQQRESVAKIRRALRSALELIDSLLELARAEAGQLEIEHQPADLRELVREIVEEYQLQAEQSSLAMEAEIPAEFPLIESDVSRIRQILGNLVLNAIKHTPGPGEISVRLATLERGAGAGQQIAIEVHNTGPGIPEDHLEQIFVEFVRLKPATQPGVGLGLSISREVARALGGDLIVASGSGEGVTFTLLLPLVPPGAGGT